jgi:competence protein ComEC
MVIAFGRLSLIAPLANAIAIPVFSFLLLPAILLATVFAALSPGSADGIWQELAAVLDAGWPWLIAAGRLPFATWWPAAQPIAVVAIAGAAGFAALMLPLRGLRAAAVVMLMALIVGRGERPLPGGWSLTVLDVGQGLAAVVETRDHALVFDTGPRWRNGSAAARVTLLPWLHARGIRHIDRLVLSHDDSDHTGGTRALLDALPVRDVIAGPRVRLNPPPASCRRGDGWRWDGVAFSVLHPARETSGSDNDNTCVLRVAGAGGSALLLADPEGEAEEELLTQPLAADVVLVPHHGSRTSSGARFVSAVGARLGIVSAGFGNRWNLPDAAVVARWQAAHTTVLTTAGGGAISVDFPPGPGDIGIRAERLAARRWWRRRAAP